jgi:hypothetical protein
MNDDPTMRWLAVQEQANELTREYPEWRYGQALFNALHRMDPVLANKIRSGPSDPFHDDGRIEAFGRAVMEAKP